MQEARAQCLDQEDPLAEDMATHSSILAWRIPCTEEPGGLQSIVLHRVGHIGSNLARMHYKPITVAVPTPVFLPGESQGREPGGLPSMGSTESDKTEAT